MSRNPPSAISNIRPVKNEAGVSVTRVCNAEVLVAEFTHFCASFHFVEEALLSVSVHGDEVGLSGPREGGQRKKGPDPHPTHSHVSRRKTRPQGFLRTKFISEVDTGALLKGNSPENRGYPADFSQIQR
jgi:hypothetical protein